MKKILTIFTLLLLSFTLVSCLDSDEKAIDATKTQLYVSNYNGDFGDVWLDKMIERFELLKKDVSYEEGKLGVQVRKVNSKKQGSQVLDEMITSTNDVFFTEGLPYLDGALQNYFLDISEAVKEKLTKYGETESIEDKLTEQQKDWFDVNGSYYGIPHYEGYYMMNYDVDTFDEKSLFLNDAGSFTNYNGRGIGQDGVKGTYDDGLPKNSTEFFKLVNEMERQKLKPISWPGMYKQYAANYMSSYQAAYEGYDQMMLNYTFDSESNDNPAKNLITVDNGVVKPISETMINAENGYLLKQQAGIYYALDLLEKLIDGNKWYTGSFNTSQTHKDSQNDFLIGSYESSKTEIGLLIDGTWWENGASGTFDAMANRYPNSGKYQRRFGIMPFPMPDNHSITENTLLDHLSAVSFVNKNVPEYKKQLAIDFLQFSATNESLTEFTITTNTPKAYSYSIKESELNAMTFYGKTVWNLRENSKIIYKMSAEPIYYKNQSQFTNHTRVWESGTRNIPVDALKDGMSSELYFRNMLGSSKSIWPSLER